MPGLWSGAEGHSFLTAEEGVKNRTTLSVRKIIAMEWRNKEKLQGFSLNKGEEQHISSLDPCPAGQEFRI